MALSSIEAQSLLYKWFCIRGQASMMAISNAVHGISIYDPIAPINVSTVFFPLARKGLVEFVGKGVWRISSPQIVMCRSQESCSIIASHCVAEDALNELRNLAKQTSEDEFHVVRLSCPSHSVKEWGKKYGIPVIIDAGLHILKRIPTISNVYPIELLEAPCPGFPKYIWANLNWKPNTSGTISAGYYKMREEPYSKRFLYNGRKWFRMCSRILNPDADYIARWAAYSFRDKHIIVHNHKTQVLKVDRPFPILVERALNSVSYHRVNSADLNSRIFHCITGQHVAELKRIFSPKLVLEK